MDRTERTLEELKRMVSTGEIKGRTSEKIEILIENVRNRKMNLFDLRKSNAGEVYGDELVEIVATAYRRQQVNENQAN